MEEPSVSSTTAGEAHGNFVACKKEGLWLVVDPPDDGGGLTTQTLWKDNQLARFTKGEIPLRRAEEMPARSGRLAGCKIGNDEIHSGEW